MDDEIIEDVAETQSVFDSSFADAVADVCKIEGDSSTVPLADGINRRKRQIEQLRAELKILLACEAEIKALSVNYGAPLTEKETDLDRGGEKDMDDEIIEEVAETQSVFDSSFADAVADVCKIEVDSRTVLVADGINRRKRQIEQLRAELKILLASEAEIKALSVNYGAPLTEKEVTVEIFSSSDKPVFVLRKGVFAVCTGFETVLDHKMVQQMEHIELMYEADHRSQSLTTENKIFMSIPMVIVRNGKKEGLFVEAEQLKYDNVTISSNYKPVFVLRNNVFKVWNGVQTVDLEGIPSREPIKLVYEAKHRDQSVSAGNKIFRSIPVVLVGLKGKEVLLVEVGGQYYKENKASGGTNACLFSSVELEANFTLPQQKDLSLEAYGSYLYNNMVNTPQKQATVGGLIALFSGILVQPLITGTAVTNPLNFHVGNTTNTLLTSSEAVLAHSSKIAYIILLMTCYIGAWLLVLLPMPSAWQIGTTLLLVITPFLYILQLLFNASSSGVAVACGGLLNLPLTGFAVLGSFGIALIFVLITLLINYWIWRLINKGDPPRA